ncbi:hypothetical protein M758_3G214500 [Ceratodon purpureus]|nr:hypothetical protein M758_3G214500 [Ceratodon purpureus]
MALHVQSALHGTGMTSVLHSRFSNTSPVAPIFRARSCPTSVAAFLKRPCFHSPSDNLLYNSTLPSMWCCIASYDIPQGRLQRPQVITSDGVKFDEMALPPLVSSTVIPDLPPPPAQASFSVLCAAKEHMKNVAKRWSVHSFESWTHPGISFTNEVYGSTSSRDRFVVIATLQTFSFMLDDIFCDAPNESVLEEFGISRSICKCSQKLAAFFKRLNSIFRQQEIPSNPTPIEGVTWELGHDMRRLSNPEWFNKFADCLLEHQIAGVSSHVDHIADDQLFLKEVEAYAQMRVLNSGGRWVMMLVEFATNVYLGDEFSAHPILHQLTNAAVIHCVYVNDLFSYPKEMFEENPRNIIKMFMQDSNDGGSGLSQAAWKAVDLINTQTHTVAELEKKFDSEVFAVRSYIDGVKGVMTGNIYFHSVDNRYRHPNSVFPELREIITNAHETSV